MERRLDVSDLEPCEPLERALKAIDELQPGEYLRMIHRREPNLLYPMLQKMGFDWHTQAGGPSNYEVFVWKKDDELASGLVGAQVRDSSC